MQAIEIVYQQEWLCRVLLLVCILVQALFVTLQAVYLYYHILKLVDCNRNTRDAATERFPVSIQYRHCAPVSSIKKTLLSHMLNTFKHSHQTIKIKPFLHYKLVENILNKYFDQIISSEQLFL